MSRLAIDGGQPAVPKGLNHAWPQFSDEDVAAIVALLRPGGIWNSHVVDAFEREFATFIGSRYALAFPNGTAAMLAAMWAVGVAPDTEVICPANTW